VRKFRDDDDDVWEELAEELELAAAESEGEAVKASVES
jgi:hypothetical protein